MPVAGLSNAIEGCFGCRGIDANRVTNPKLADADAAKVKKLRADGETAHKAGKHDDSMKAPGEAKKLLAIRRDLPREARIDSRTAALDLKECTSPAGCELPSSPE